MKNYWGSLVEGNSGRSISGTPNNKDIEYIFVKQKPNIKMGVKESRIWESLNEIGIFQINPGVLFKDYAFYSKS